MRFLLKQSLTIRLEFDFGNNYLFFRSLEVLGFFNAGHVTEEPTEERTLISINGTDGFIISFTLDSDAVFSSFELVL